MTTDSLLGPADAQFVWLIYVVLGVVLRGYAPEFWGLTDSPVRKEHGSAKVQ